MSSCSLPPHCKIKEALLTQGLEDTLRNLVMFTCTRARVVVAQSHEVSSPSDDVWTQYVTGSPKMTVPGLLEHYQDL